MVALSGQKELFEKLAELLVARITKSYVVYTYRSYRRGNYMARRKFILNPKCSNDYSACFYF